MERGRGRRRGCRWLRSWCAEENQESGHAERKGAVFPWEVMPIVVKCLQVKVMRLSPGVAEKGGRCGERHRFTEHKWSSIPLAKKLG